MDKSTLVLMIYVGSFIFNFIFCFISNRFISKDSRYYNDKSDCKLVLLLSMVPFFNVIVSLMIVFIILEMLLKGSFTKVFDFIFK